MRITKEELDRIKMKNSRVLIKLDRMLNDRIVFSNGQQIFISTALNLSEHVQTVGVIEKAPNRIVANLNRKTSVIEFKPDHVQLQKGDKVYCDIHAMIMALGKKLDETIEHPNESWLICEDQIYVILPYQEIFMVIRPAPEIDNYILPQLPDTTKSTFAASVIEQAKESRNVKDGVFINDRGSLCQLIMLNGYCLMEVIEQPFAVTKLILPPSLRKVAVNKQRVVLVGPSNIEYNEKVFKDGDVKPGQMVYYSRWAAMRAENYYHVTLGSKDVKLNVIQKRYMVAVEE